MRSTRSPLSPLLRRLLEMPGYLYDVHAGWLLGRRFLRLTHIGRRTGHRYRTMLEVIGENPRTGEILVLAGLGRSAQWLRNVEAANAVEIAIGCDRFRPRHRLLTPEEASEVLANYERHNRRLTPIVRWVLSRLVGWRYTVLRLRGSGSSPRCPWSAFGNTERTAGCTPTRQDETSRATAESHLVAQPGA
jgi:deazaflavin-dependent oxidoreductase (nitroreductase family)